MYESDGPEEGRIAGDTGAELRQDGVVRCQRRHERELAPAQVGRVSDGLRGLVRSCQNGFYRLVLKNEPRSLRLTRVWWWRNQHAE